MSPERLRRIAREVLMALGLVMAAAAEDCAAADAAASAFKYSGSVRMRQEELDGQFRPGFDNHDDVLVMRSSLFAEWDTGLWRLGGELVDSRAYDTDAGSALTANDVDAFEPVQAYVAGDFDAPFGKGSSASLQAGRFTMNLGSRRLIASDDFRNTPQGYTGLRTDLKFSSGGAATFFFVMPQLHRPDDFAALRDNAVKLDHEGRSQRLWGSLLSRSGLPGGLMAEAGFVRLLEQDSAGRPTRNRALTSLSARLMRDAAAGKWDYEIEGIAQTGTVRASTALNAAKLSVQARFVHADLGYTVAGSWKPHINVEFDYASGEGPGAHFGRFDTLYGMRRADLAPSGIYSALGRTNLSALGLRLEGSPTQRLDVLATWKWLWAANRHDSFSTTGIRDASGASGSQAGQQLDGRLRYWLVPRRLRAEVTAVWLIRGDLLQHAPNASPHGDTHYGAASITWSF
jgi:Alginate export